MCHQWFNVVVEFSIVRQICHNRNNNRHDGFIIICLTEWTACWMSLFEEILETSETILYTKELSGREVTWTTTIMQTNRKLKKDTTHLNNSSAPVKPPSLKWADFFIPSFPNWSYICRFSSETRQKIYRIRNGINNSMSFDATHTISQNGIRFADQFELVRCFFDIVGIFIRVPSHCKFFVPFVKTNTHSLFNDDCRERCTTFLPCFYFRVGCIFRYSQSVVIICIFCHFNLCSFRLFWKFAYVDNTFCECIDHLIL